MINLLPPEIKSAYHYALRNVVLRRWIVAIVFGLIGLGFIGTYGWVTLHRSIDDYTKQVASKQAVLRKENQEATYAEVQDISNSFKLVDQVLSKEVLFSKLLKQMGAVMPAGTNLTDLNINQTQGALSITAVAANYNTATQVQVNLADPANQIFAKADIISIVCNAKAADEKHPCTVTIQALFAQKNPFLFINQQATKP